MDADRQLSRAVTAVPTVSVDSRYYRFASQSRMPAALNGSAAGGRWGTPRAFPVHYLADDYEGCVIEAYRHAIDSAMDPGPTKVKLGLLTCDVQASSILDLTRAGARMSLGLEPAILYSEPQQPEGAASAACSRVAQIAHQLGMHGILVPAATQRGHTLAIFQDLLPAGEQPVRVGPVTHWEELPADPRRLRVISQEGP